MAGFSKIEWPIFQYRSQHFQDPVQYWTALTTRLPEPFTVCLPGRHVPPVDVVRTPAGLQVTFSWHEVPGAPGRQHLHRQERMLGHWLQVRFNARHSYDTSWYYEKHVLNLGVASTYSPSLFLSGAPTCTATDLADLR